MFKKGEYWTREESKKAVDEAKKRIMNGEVPNQFYSQLGYSNPLNLYKAFKKITGQTIREWAKENNPDYNPYREARIDILIERAKKKIEKRKTLRSLDLFVEKEFGRWDVFSRAFKSRAGLCPRNYLKNIITKYNK